MKNSYCIIAVYYDVRTKEEYKEPLVSGGKLFSTESLQDAYTICSNLALDYKNKTNFVKTYNKPWSGYYKKLKYLSPELD